MRFYNRFFCNDSMHGNSWVIINAWAECELANIIPQNVPRTRVVPVQIRLYSFTSTGTQLTWNVFGWKIGVSPWNYAPWLTHLHGENLLWPTSSLFSNNKGLQKEHCIMLVLLDIIEANDNWTREVILKAGGHDPPSIKNLGKWRFGGLFPKDQMH